MAKPLRSKMGKISTAIEYAKKIATVGAFRESSIEVSQALCKKFPPDRKIHVVELGVGHGGITRVILENISAESKLTGFEIHDEFVHHVKKEILDPRFSIIHDSAEKIKDYIDEPVDFFVTSLPFSFLSKEVRTTIARDSYTLLRPGGYFCQYVYNKFSTRILEETYDEVEKDTIIKFPIEFVFYWLKSE